MFLQPRVASFYSPGYRKVFSFRIDTFCVLILDFFRQGSIAILFLFADSLLGSASEEEEDDENSTTSSVLKHHGIHGSLPPAPGETNNNSLPHTDINNTIGQVRDLKIVYYV